MLFIIIFKSVKIQRAILQTTGGVIMWCHSYFRRTSPPVVATAPTIIKILAVHYSLAGIVGSSEEQSEIGHPSTL